MKRLLAVLFSGLFSLSCSNNQRMNDPLNDPSASYSVAFAPDKKTVHVDAQFSLDENLLFMFVQGTKELPDGEASFVKNLEMKNTAGDVIPLKDLGLGDWEHGGNRNDRVTLSYDVELNHHRYPWPGGIDEVVFVRDDAVFFTGDALFILPGERIRDIDISITVPQGWNISVPWKKTGDNSYRAADSRDLVVNCGMVGTHDVRTVVVDSFQLQLAIGGTQKKSAELFVQTMAPALRAYTQLFGGSRFSDYLIVIHDDVQSDGGAFRSSFSQVIDGEANANSVVTWGHTMLHEIFHLWNGNAIIPSAQEEWFKEGFTDYMTVKHLYSLKIFTENNFFKAMENTHRKYVLARMMEGMTNRPAVSIRDAGNEKAANRLLVYGGGSLVAFMLDVELRERSGGRHGAEDLLKTLYTEFGAADKRYSYDDIIRISGALAGSDMRWFFDAFVTGTGTLDLHPYYEKLGLQLDTFVEEIYLSRMPEPTDSQKKLFASIFPR